jgi:hypothetical protein
LSKKHGKEARAKSRPGPPGGNLSRLFRPDGRPEIRKTRPAKAFYSVRFERSYKDGDTWKSSDSFNSSGLLLLAKLADHAHSEIEKLRANDKAAPDA